MEISKDKVVDVARSMIGTPFHAGGRLPHVGLDCSGLIVCVARQCGLVESAFDTPVHSAFTALSALVETMPRVSDKITDGNFELGDIIVTTSKRCSCHMYIVTKIDGEIIYGVHATDQVNPPRVLEQRIVLNNQTSVFGVYRLKGVV